MELTFRAVPTLEVAKVWPQAETLLAPALEMVTLFYRAEDIRERLVDDRMQLWVIEDGARMRMALVTQILTYPRARAVSLVLCGGEGFGLWKNVLQDMASWGRGIGCRAIVGHAGRDGWERAAGLTKIGSAYSMEI